MSTPDLLFIIPGAFVLAFVLALAFSFFFPRKLRLMDRIRLAMQKPLLDFFGNTILGGFPKNEKGEHISRPQILTWEMTLPQLDRLTTGDVFLTQTAQYLSARFTPGKWKHSGFYIGSKEQAARLFGEESDAFLKLLPHYRRGDERLILDSSSEGVAINPFEHLSNLSRVSLLKSLCAFRLKRNPEVIRKVLEKGFTYLGLPYDYDMDTEDISSIYCSELVYHSLKEIGISIEVFKVRAGRKIITPTDLCRYLGQNANGRANFSFVCYLSAENYGLVDHAESEMAFV